MKHTQETLTHKTVPARAAPRGGPAALVLLHGRGADEDDLLGLSEYLDERLLCIAARAPHAFHAGQGYTWYDVIEIGKPEPAMFAESYRRLAGFMDLVRAKYGIDPSRLFLFGFSMGSMMAYAYALTHPGAVAGVVAASGYIPEEAGLTIDWARQKGAPYFVSHGVYDPVIPVHMGRRAGELLTKAAADLTYREYPMQHQIGEECLRDAAVWLERRIQ